MKPRWFAHPALSVMLALAWLLLQGSLALPQIISAVVLAIVLPRLVDGFLGRPVYPRAPLTALRLWAVVMWDVMTSNVTVARIVLSPWSRPQPAWVNVPLDAANPTAITLLASIITMTPGTLSCVVDAERRCILVHALDCDDPPALAAAIKSRYERPLMEIFE